MASKKVRPTPPPSGPALARPALGALLLGLSGMACGDDGTGSDTANDSQPPMPESEGPMPNPTTDGTTGSTTAVPPMIPPTTTTDDGADSGSSSGSTGEIPPMPPPTTGETTDGTTGGSTGEIPPMPPPMPPPDGGGAPDEDQEL